MTDYDSYVLCLCDGFGNFRDDSIYHNEPEAMDAIAARGLSVVACRPMEGFIGTTVLVMYAVDVPTIDMTE